MSALEVSHSEVRELFDDNAPTYDEVNSVISLGLDARWRDWVARKALAKSGARVLDAFAGTGLVGLRAAALGGRVTLADISPGMLDVAAKRASARGLRVERFVTDLADGGAADGAPAVPGAPFDAITIVFGARYLEDPSAVIRRLSKLLADGGRVVIMDFVEPSGGLLTRAASVYFIHVLPRLAAVLAGRKQLYERLIATTRAIHGREHLERIVRDAGLSIVETKTMGFGLVVGVVGAVDAETPPG